MNSQQQLDEETLKAGQGAVKPMVSSDEVQDEVEKAKITKSGKQCSPSEIS
jgi:hypothetical protein